MWYCDLRATCWRASDTPGYRALACLLGACFVCAEVVEWRNVCLQQERVVGIYGGEGGAEKRRKTSDRISQSLAG